MCGIAGQINFDKTPADRKLLEKMALKMEKRGPDDDGLLIQENMGFSHRRLKIMDLSDGSAQPMFDDKTGYGIVFNGAIYNYPEIRTELEEKGHTFESRGDTEVILKAYAQWGEECLKRFNGMFAFAIWNPETKEVFLARDRLGIKPLYFFTDKDTFLFASFLPALLESPKISRKVNPVALHHYMSFHSVVPSPHTIVQDIQKLPPATYLKLTPQGVKEIKTYWTISYENQIKNLSTDEYAEMTLTSLRSSVKRRLIADVPVGVLLSGGLDSSLITGLLAEAGAQNLNTYSIGFESLDKEKGDEFSYSDIVAKEFGTKHHKIFISPNETLEHLPDAIAAMAEPMVSHDNIGFYLLSREVSKTIKVVQSGQGADEIYGGYHWYPPLLDDTVGINRYSELFFDIDHSEFTKAVNAKFVEKDYSYDFVKEHFAKKGAERTIDRALRLDSTVMLVDDPVKRVDNMTMAWGLEARVPFLDHEFVELAARIPAEAKVSNGGKHALKKAARKVIPSAVIDRPKGYFPVPALKYLRGGFLEYVKNIMNTSKARSRKIFNQGYINELLQNPEEHITPLRGSKLWQAALLEQWLNENNIE